MLERNEKKWNNLQQKYEIWSGKKKDEISLKTSRHEI